MDEHDEVLEVTEHDIDAAWGEEEISDGVEHEEAVEAPPADAQPKAEENPPAVEKGKEDTKADQPEESFSLKHLSETKTVNRDEVVALAQKGMDYDRIRQERDQLRQYRQEADPALGLIKSYADRSGMDVAGYIDFVRKQELMAQGVNEPTAAAQVEVEKRQAALDAQNAEAEAMRQQQEREQQEERKRSESRARDMDAFLSAYPTVKPDDIPPTVWERVAAGESLMGAYTMHRNKELESQLAAERQNKQNQRRSPGSLSTGMEGSKKDDIDSVWYADD